ncbi:MAG: hypothetical protein EOR30_00180 [Mesorhizobium sp.]|nr:MULTISPECIES: glucose-6-phosphate isomerase family protein [unclassified Mesorhizobium]RUV72380.1 hypothetical protein EOA78_14855 [Mesorhizobium sp. M5C.F.Cr.IN.023.01.1.1]RWF88270.1 MAG: hypothetical protein EOQ36_09105 [Mesorhizobium sp.]RWF93110.1 MAG: hypothetical protein EOQ45_18230 [Mesorhizobium sp.]RWI42361.1 MAG: hypothetical protein EOR14_04295 [Mesorhizobium sp.]RWI53571.1 MAG: hypothetical protein EOR15_02250 [Mesorhizobium sp.]
MTRGHFHARRDRAEFYYTQAGQGILLLQFRDREVMSVAMAPGVCAFIAPDWAHRSVNVGPAPLVFLWFAALTLGRNRGAVPADGWGVRVVQQDGMPVLISRTSGR